MEAGEEIYIEISSSFLRSGGPESHIRVATTKSGGEKEQAQVEEATNVNKVEATCVSAVIHGEAARQRVKALHRLTELAGEHMSDKPARGLSWWS